MAKRTYLAYAILVGIAATNREMTAVLLVAAWFGLRPNDWRWGIFYAGVAVLVYGGLRVFLPALTMHYTVWEMLQGNLVGWKLQNFAVYGGLLLPLFITGIVGWRFSNRSLTRLTTVVSAIYLPLWATLAFWEETRLLMPLLILLIPMALTRVRAS